MRSIPSISPIQGGQHIPVTAPAPTLARMAEAVGLAPDDLTQVGRADAAEVLTDLADAQPEPPRVVPDAVSALVSRVMRDDRLTQAQKTRVVEILIAAAEAERRRVDQRLNERAEELIKLLSED